MVIEQKRKGKKIPIDKTSFSIVIPTSLCIEFDMLVNRRQKPSEKKIYRQDLIIEAMKEFIVRENGGKTIKDEIEEIKNEIRDLKTNVAQ